MAWNFCSNCGRRYTEFSTPGNPRWSDAPNNCEHCYEGLCRCGAPATEPGHTGNPEPHCKNCD